jgi:CubicO group peptidase (beta-lactamase class C family)
MSVSKGFAGLVVAMLTDRDRLDPDERVVSYWPEFAANGKQDILVRDFLLHTSGVIGLGNVADVLGWDGRGWDDLDAIAAALAAAPPAWPPGTRTGYHAVTFGWLVGELVRRVDGRTLGQFFRDEVAQPLGLRSAIGVPVEEQGDIAIVHPEGMDTAAFPLSALNRKLRRQMRDPATLLGKASLGDGTRSIFDVTTDFLNAPFWHAAEVPASNGVTSAPDLARLFAAVAGGGELDGVRLLSQKTLERFMTVEETGIDAVLTSALGPLLGRVLAKRLSPTRAFAFTVNDRPKKAVGPNRRTVAAEGYGGQLVFADPDRGVSAAFVRSALLQSQKELGDLVQAFYADMNT